MLILKLNLYNNLQKILGCKYTCIGLFKKRIVMSRIEKILEMLQTSEKDSFLQHALALEYIKIGENEKALILFTELLEREPAYVGSYYHLGKLFEKLNEIDKAIVTYEKGMDEAKKAGDKHSYNELMMAKDEVE